MTRIDIIGGGIGGMSTAWQLAQSEIDCAIHVWEKEPYLGGLAGTFEAAGTQIEKYYHHMFLRDLALIELLEEMGLSKQICWRPAKTGAYYFGTPYRLSSPLDLLKFKPLPLLDRLRMGLAVLRSKSIINWEELDDETAKAFIIRVSGQKVWDVVWEPLFKGKFNKYADQISAAWIWSKLVDRGGSRSRSGVEVLGYVRGGLGQLIDRLMKSLEQEGHQIHCGVPVTSLRMKEGKVTHLVHDGGEEKTDIVVSAVHLPQLASLLPDKLESCRHELQRIKYLGNICLILVLERSLSEFYWTNITDPTAPFVGIIEQTKWADRKDYANNHLAYISAYVQHDDKRYQMQGEEIFETYIPHLRKLTPDFDPSVVKQIWCWKTKYAQPIVTCGYRHMIPDIRSPLENLFICTMAQIYPNDRQLSNGVELGINTANSIVEYVQKG